MTTLKLFKNNNGFTKTKLLLAFACCLAVPVSVPFAATQYSQTQYASSNEVLQAGTVIPATLLTGINSDNLTTNVLAIVRQDVYDSVTGTNILIPAGSKLIGMPASVAGKKVNLSFTRIIFPNGKSVALPNEKAINGIGESGLEDRFSRHSWQQFKDIMTGAVMAGIVSGVTNRSNVKKDERTPAQEAVDGAIAQTLDGINNIVRQNTDATQPTVTIREGYQFNIILTTDLKIKPYRQANY